MTARQKTERLLTAAARFATDATNDCPNYRQASELSRVVDLIDSALARVRYAEPVA